MAEKVKALIIDPFLQNIYEKMFNKGDITQIQEAVGGNYFTSAGTFDNFDVLYVDDEGLFKDDQKLFTKRWEEYDMSLQPWNAKNYFICVFFSMLKGDRRRSKTYGMLAV